MIYPNDIEQRLGFDRIKTLAEKYCATKGAIEKVRQTNFSNNRKRIVADLSLAYEMKNILMLENGFQGNKFVDIETPLIRLSKDGSFITTQELLLLKFAIETVCAVSSFFKDSNKSKYPYLSLLVSKVETFPQLINQINMIVDETTASVKDSASKELGLIRDNRRQKEREVSRRINAIIKSAISNGITEEGATVSIRNGRAVIPVISSNKRKIKGFIHDESATGKTSFIEPEEVLIINNEIKELEYEEKREIVRILTIFTDEIREDIPLLMNNAQFINLIDFIMAKAKVAIEMNAHKPIINKEQGISLIDARHPILEKSLKKEGKAIVSLDIDITSESHIVVISGPNAGGKSVCLKCVGLLQYMVQCGFLIPASPNSETSIFNNLFVDIGDQQSIDNDLSTYSSHLENMKRMLRYSNPDSLVLIDEFGSGTEPTVGGAIAEVILAELEKKGAFGVITTHYTNLKYYAANSKGVINGAMAFDVQNITPLYQLEIGVPGSSFAFEIAQKIGLPQNIINLAKGKLDSTQVSIEKQLREIARDKLYWERKREEVRISEKKYRQINDEFQIQYDELKTKSREIVAKARREAQDIVGGANKIIENTIRQIKESQAEKERTKAARKSVEEFSQSLTNQKEIDEIEKINRKMEKLRERDANKFKKNLEKSSTPDLEPAKKLQPQKAVEVGDKVRIKGQEVIGNVVSINKKRVVVAFGAISTTTTISQLEIVSNNEYRKQQKDTSVNYYNGGIVVNQNYDVSDKRLNFKSEIDVRGKRVDEVYPIIEKLVDEAYMLGFKELKILHGKGTGALKEEIRKFLYTNSYVKSAKDEHVDFGGAGITVVMLK